LARRSSPTSRFRRPLLELPARRSRPRPTIDLGLANPPPNRLPGRPQLLGDRTDRLPLRPLHALMLQHHPHRTIAQLARVLPMSWHRPILHSHNEASTDPGAVQLLTLVLMSVVVVILGLV
jgi:hypothetical protein